MQGNCEFKKKELKQNQKSYRHENLVNGRSPMQFKHTVAHICNTKLKIQNQTAAKTHQNERSFRPSDGASESSWVQRRNIASSPMLYTRRDGPDYV